LRQCVNDRGGSGPDDIWRLHEQLLLPPAIFLRELNKHRRKPRHARTNCVCLYAKFVKTNMTRRVRSSWAESITPSIASIARSTRWRLFALTASAVSAATASKRTDESSVVSTAHARPAQRS